MATMTVRRLTRRISAPVITPTYSVAAATIPIGLSRNGRTAYGRRVADNTLMTSVNDGTSWILAYTFSASERILSAMEMGNGELIVAADTVGLSNGHLYVSDGWPASFTTATWTKVKSTVYYANHVWFEPRYGSVNVDPLGGPVVVASEYGKQTAGLADPQEAAVRGFLSVDYGETWINLVNLLDIATGASLHIHGVAYDPWWDRIWLSHGDAGGTSILEIFYSDDWRNLLTGGVATWQRVSRTDVAAQATTGGYQSVQIIPLESCVLFTSDDQPNAAGYRLGRRGFRKLGRMSLLNTATRTNSPSIIGVHAVADNRGGALLSVTQQTAVGAGTGICQLIHTPDGHRFWKVAADSAIVAANSGFDKAFGPTASGKILGAKAGADSFVIDLVSPSDLPPGVGGTASVADAGTIAHGLGFPPKSYALTPTVAGRRVAVTAVDATNLTVSLTDAAGAAVAVAENVSWSAGP